MPSKSENYGHSIIESFLSSRPVITSKNTPWNNLFENHAGYNCELNILDITNAIIFFSLMNQFEFEKFVHGSKNYVINNVNINRDIENYIKMFK